jgi:hypothetical protein
VLIVAAAAFTTWSGATGEGIFMCGRELEETVSCPGGGQVFRFESVCIAGNPATEVEVRPGVLPFMFAVSEESTAAACAALRR